MKNICILIVVSFFVFMFSCTEDKQNKSFYFDENGISQEVLGNYLDRSVTMAVYLVPKHPEGRRTYPYHDDDIRMIKNIGAKFIGRAIYRWGGESRLNDSSFWSDAKALIDTLHAFDPEIIFQGCLFEIISDVCMGNFNRFAFSNLQYTENGNEALSFVQSLVPVHELPVLLRTIPVSSSMHNLYV